jgi:SAM-dependent methyltransferase
MIALSTVGRRVATRVVGPTEWNLRRRIRAEGGRLPAEVPRVDWMNTVLKTRRQIDEAVQEVGRCGLVRHPDRAKNWDALAALRTILTQTTTSARVLEMGARLYSVMLPWLYQYGFRHLTGIDLVYTKPIRRGPIRYEFGDLTRTRFAAGSFDVVCAMSVIEHGVEPRAYFAEASRLLAAGGLLLTSTDCWKDRVDTRGQVAYGKPITIFTIEEIAAMLATAREYGLRPLGDLDLVCEDPAVRWERYGLEFTFVCFALARHSRPAPHPEPVPALRSKRASAALTDPPTVADIPRSVEPSRG